MTLALLKRAYRFIKRL